MKQTLIMKFGGAAVASSAQFDRIAEIIVYQRKHYQNIVVVVSAMGQMTDQLIQLAKEVHPTPPGREYDMLVSVGERISIALLAMALEKRQQKAFSFTGSQSGIITSPHHSEARILEVRPRRIQAALELGSIAIVAGFQGVSHHGEITTLGRGGSDLSAVALGAALQADIIEFYKDVGGIFSDDPKKNGAPILFPRLTYDEALSIVQGGAKVLQERSIHLAKKNALLLHVRSFQEFDPNVCPAANIGTIIGNEEVTRPEQVLYEDH